MEFIQELESHLEATIIPTRIENEKENENIKFILEVENAIEVIQTAYMDQKFAQDRTPFLEFFEACNQCIYDPLNDETHHKEVNKHGDN